MAEECMRFHLGLFQIQSEVLRAMEMAEVHLLRRKIDGDEREVEIREELIGLL
jgi:hypothetical protein